jgi:hypothetical protein
MIRGQGGGSLSWQGELSLPQASGSGYLELSDIYLPNAWRFIEPWVNFELVNGRLSVAGRYVINLREAFRYTVSEGSIVLSEMAIAPKIPMNLPDTDVQLPSFSLKGIELDGRAKHVDVAEVNVEALELSGWSEGTNVSLIEMFQMHFPEQETALAVQASEKMPIRKWIGPQQLRLLI